MVNQAPLGIRFVSFLGSVDRTARYKFFVLVLTFFCYTSYHLSRKPISIVKSVLHRKNCSIPLLPGQPVVYDNTTDCDWKPFNDGDFGTLLGSLDLAYLFAYAVGMFCSGHIAERMNLRHFLALGMISSGIMTAAFGVGYFVGIHVLWYYILVQIIGGFVQSSGWPSVVACVGNWYGKGKRGLIMGIWNSHTSVGNILGSLIAGVWVNEAWGWSFVVPGIIIASLGVIVFFFLIPDPSIVGCKNPVHHTDKQPEITSDLSSDVSGGINNSKLHPDLKKGGESIVVVSESNMSNKPNEQILNAKNAKDTPHYGAVFYAKDASNLERPNSYNNGNVNFAFDVNAGKDKSQGGANGYPTNPLVQNGSTVQEEALVSKHEETEDKEAITIWRALAIPGVIEFSLCLFFAKLVSYTFLFWLPKYISAKTNYDAEVAGDLSTLFDVGGILGGIIAGVVSDYTRGRASTCCVMLALAAPMMFIYNTYGSVNYAHSVGLLLCCGFMVNGPYALITTAVSADLGTHKSLRGNSKALATVTAIIDGTGSIGAAIGPLLTGVISKSGWTNVFWMLIAADLFAMVFLIRLIYKEIKLWRLTGCSQELEDVTINISNQ